MNIKILSAFIIVLYLFSSCGSDKNNSVKNIEAIKASGGCYNTSNEKIIEMVNVVFDEKGVTGTGKRSYLLYSESFDLNISGKINKGGSFDVAITANSTMSGREKVSETTYETWVIKEKTLEVNNRNSSHYIGNLTYIKVNCEGSTKKDSALYDAFLGFHEGYAAVIKNGKWGIVNKNWEQVIPCNYYELGNVSEGAVKFYNENIGRYGILDVAENKVIVEAKYTHVTSFSEGFAAALDDDSGKWAIINRKGEMVVQPTYWSVSFYPQNPYLMFFNEGMANVAIGDAKWGFINTKLENVIPFQFIFAEPFKDGMAKVNKNGHDWYYIDKTGKCVKDCK
jgi:hypothetical protein